MEDSHHLEIKHVLCPVDLSPISDMALRYAAVAAPRPPLPGPKNAVRQFFDGRR